MSDNFHHPNELHPPDDAVGNGAAGEVLRAWIIKGGLQVSLAPLAFPHTDLWGMLLVDIARHVSRALENEDAGAYAENLTRIRAMINDEFDRPTDLGTTNKVRSN